MRKSKKVDICVAAMFPYEYANEDNLDYQASMLREFGHFHPNIVPIIE